MQLPEGVIELCHVVDDMDAAIRYWTDLMAAGPFYVGDFKMPDGWLYRGQPAAMDIQVGFAFAGDLLIELVRPTPGVPGVFAEVIEKSGPGFHHVMLRGDTDALRARMEAGGHQIAWDGRLPSGERCTLYDTTRETGGFVEVMDLSPAVQSQFAKMRAAHEGWDRQTRPVRPMAEVF